MKVRIALVSAGRYAATGYWNSDDKDAFGTCLDMLDDEGPERRYIITAEVELPAIPEIAGQTEVAE